MTSRIFHFSPLDQPLPTPGFAPDFETSRLKNTPVYNLVIAPAEEAYRLFLVITHKDPIEYQLLPFLTDQIKLANVLLNCKGWPIIFLEGYQRREHWEFIKNFIDMKEEKVKS